MKLFAKKTASPKYAFKEQKKEPEISSPVDFQIQQWLNLKKWKDTDYWLDKFDRTKTINISFGKFFSVTDKVHVGIQFALRKTPNEFEYKIDDYYTYLTNKSLGKVGENQKVLTRKRRSALLALGVDPTQFEYWFNYDSGTVKVEWTDSSGSSPSSSQIAPS